MRQSHIIKNLITQPPFWISNEAERAKKIARMVKDHCCILSEIMTKATLLVKIYLTLIFPGISRNGNAQHLKNAKFNFSTYTTQTFLFPMIVLVLYAVAVEFWLVSFC